jgi:FeS assembly SUF system protein
MEVMEQQTISSIEKTVIEAQVIEAIRTCFDPEIPVNIYELGLIYDVIVGDTGEVEVKMTLTSPHCPAAQSLPPDVEKKVRAVQGVTNAKVTIVWEPPWTPALMSEAAKLELGMM